jgi:hypothetical protein
MLLSIAALILTIATLLSILLTLLFVSTPLIVASLDSTTTVSAALTTIATAVTVAATVRSRRSLLSIVLQSTTGVSLIARWWRQWHGTRAATVLLFLLVRILRARARVAA